jgi:hypothetical protein
MRVLFHAPVTNRFQLGTAGMFVRRDVKVRALTAAHANRVILATLTTSNVAERFALNTAPLSVRWGVHRFADYPIPLKRITVIVEFDSLDDGVAFGIIEGRAGAFDKDPIFVLAVLIEYRLELFGFR